MCQHCNGSGFVEIINPYDIQTIAKTWPDGPPNHFNDPPHSNEPERPLRRSFCTVRCACRKLKAEGQYFDPLKACNVNGSGGVDWQQIRDWFAARAVRIAQSRKFNEWEPA